VRWYDVVNVSLYKGLGAPMGALVCGPAAVLERAAWARRVLGGTLRQAGVVAAAGLVALDDIERLREDHELAGTLAGRLADVLPPSVLPSDPVETNIVVAHLGAAATAFVAALQRDGVLVTEIVPGVVRFVTHRDVDERAVDRAVTASTRAFADVMPLLDGAL
jgi:threonine aldolase